MSVTSVTVEELRRLRARMGDADFEQSAHCALLGVGIVLEFTGKRVEESGASPPAVWAAEDEDLAEEHTDAFLGPGSRPPERFASEQSRFEELVWVIPYSPRPLLLGRRSTCDITIGAEWISQRHLLVHFRSPSCAVLQDAGALNGSWVRGRRLRAGEMVEIFDGDPLLLGRSLFSYCSGRSLLKLSSAREVG